MEIFACVLLRMTSAWGVRQGDRVDLLGAEARGGLA
jgi:hypothetical protein